MTFKACTKWLFGSDSKDYDVMQHHSRLSGRQLTCEILGATRLEAHLKRDRVYVRNVNRIIVRRINSERRVRA